MESELGISYDTDIIIVFLYDNDIISIPLSKGIVYGF